MDDFAVTLESLINRATDSRNGSTDSVAAADFCSIINKEPHCAHIAARVIAIKIQSPNEWEALQGLNLLDSCMRQCGSIFHAEVGKFRFLNEMIKLVSPKYLGNRTSPAVRGKVLHMMHSWTIDYARETKIREAYEMLRKQGVIKEEPVYVPGEIDPLAPVGPRSKNTIFEDDERSRLLQKLLQSKNPEDLIAANRLIKTMVKEDERRVEVNSRRITELESVHNNARLLSEMLDSYRAEQSSREELELIKELHQSCVRLKPNVLKLVSETQDNEAMLNEAISANDELDQVFNKYTTVIVLKKSMYVPPSSSATTSLLDLSTPSQEMLPPVSIDLLEHHFNNEVFSLATSESPQDHITAISSPAASPNKQSNYEVLGDIFASIKPIPVIPASQTILLPVNVQQEAKGHPRENVEVPEKTSMMRALDDLDSLGEKMLLQNLTTSCKLGSHFAKPTTKVPMNLMGKCPPPESLESSSSQTRVDTSSASSTKSPSALDLDFLAGGAPRAAVVSSGNEVQNGDDSMVDLSDDVTTTTGRKEGNENTGNAHGTPETPTKSTTVPEPSKNKVEPDIQVKADIVHSKNSSTVGTPVKKTDIKPMNDIFVSLDSIKPGTIPPLTALDERNGITVILHFAKDTPRSDVSVIVVTTISKNSSTLSNYLFQAVVPKTCKLRLLPPSSTDLPAHSPFLPPSAITQVMLIANPNKDLISLKFILSYLMDDETVTEMGEVEQLPSLS